MTETAAAPPTTSCRDRLKSSSSFTISRCSCGSGRSVVDGRIVRTRLSQAQSPPPSVSPAPLSRGPPGLRPSPNLALALMGLLNANVNDYLLPLPEAEAAEAA